MSMSRRGAMAADTLDANTDLDIAPTPDLEPIAETVRLYQEIIRTWQQAGAPHPGQPHYNLSFKTLTNDLQPLWHNILGYVMDNFGESPCTFDDVQEALEQATQREVTTDYLESVVKGTIPVIIAKNILFTKMPLRGHRTENWDRFCHVYGSKLSHRY